MSTYTLHVVSHSHWDREWYLPFELHRRRLVKLLDDLLDTIDRDPDFGSFHLDGQTIPLEDYLAVRPHQRERLARAASTGRLTVGPWYVLQDEFLTSAEAQVRNMLYGSRVAREFGPLLKVGYLADAFGHIGQMPALLAGFGIDNAVFGRGLNAAEDGSEVTWEGSDGSSVLGLYMANWYSNAMDLPAEPAALAERLRQIRDAAARYATTDQLLLMNGCDHTPCQLDISALLATARGQLDDTIVHSRLDDYARAVQAANPTLPTVRGELRSERTNGWGTLTNVLSARLYLKQANWRCQLGLSRYLEPLQAVATLLGDRADRDFRTYLWKLLLQNHPHDSICGCSIDPVHREMETRFDKVEQLAGQLSNEALAAIAGRLDTSAAGANEVALVVWNPLGSARHELVEATVSFPDGTEAGTVALRDGAGQAVGVEVVEDLGRAWDYELPDDRFRVPYHCRRFRVRFVAEVPAFGCVTYFASPSTREALAPSRAEGDLLENEFLRVELRGEGAFDLLDKRTGRWYRDLGRLVYSRDCGDEYIYKAPADDLELAPRMSEEGLAEIRLSPLGAEAERFGLWIVPDPEDEDGQQLIGLTQHLRLAAGSATVELALTLRNESATNYRLRALFPTDAQADCASADGHFEVVQRPIATWHGWTNPSNCQPCQDFVDVSDATGGLTVANRGLPEYEILRDGRNTIAMTLLRGVDRLGDWGDFPTPDAQCQGENFAELALVPHAGELRGSGADLAARAYNAPLVVTQTGAHAGTLPATGSWLRVDPAEVVLSAVRWAEDREGLLVRCYNPWPEPVEVTLTPGLGLTRAWRCNLDEERGEALEGWVLRLGGKEIVTLELA